MNFLDDLVAQLAGIAVVQKLTKTECLLPFCDSLLSDAVADDQLWQGFRFISAGFDRSRFRGH